jgi:hypothetical protein
MMLVSELVLVLDELLGLMKGDLMDEMMVDL